MAAPSFGSRVLAASLVTLASGELAFAETGAERSQRARQGLIRRIAEVEASVPPRPEQQLIKESRLRVLGQAVEQLGSGKSIRSVIAGVRRAIRNSQRDLKWLEKDYLTNFSILDDRGRLQAEALHHDVLGLEQAEADLLDQTDGLRGSSVTFELGGLVRAIVIGAAVRGGIQFNGIDTGRFPIKPFVRWAAGGGFLVRGRVNGLIGAFNKTYVAGGFGPMALNASFSLSDPISPTKIGIQVANGPRFGIAGRRTLTLDGSIPYAPTSPMGGIVVESNYILPLRRKIMERESVKKAMLKYPFLEQVLSDYPPTDREALAMIRQGTKGSIKKLWKRAGEKLRQKLHRPTQAERDRED